jgi:drug/metabolite transporter (DMT)-like permease
MENMDFAMFLNWIVFGGGAVMCASWVLDRVAWFQAQSPELKKVIAYVLSAVFGIGAYLLVTLAPDFVALAQPYFMVIASVFSSIFLSNVFHKYDKAAPKG